MKRVLNDRELKNTLRPSSTPQSFKRTTFDPSLPLYHFVVLWGHCHGEAVSFRAPGKFTYSWTISLTHFTPWPLTCFHHWTFLSRSDCTALAPGRCQGRHTGPFPIGHSAAPTVSPSSNDVLPQGCDDKFWRLWDEDIRSAHNFWGYT